MISSVFSVKKQNYCFRVFCFHFCFLWFCFVFREDFELRISEHIIFLKSTFKRVHKETGRVTWSGMAAVQELEGVINPFKYWGLAAGRGLGPCFFLECVSQSLPRAWQTAGERCMLLSDLPARAMLMDEARQKSPYLILKKLHLEISNLQKSCKNQNVIRTHILPLLRFTRC